MNCTYELFLWSVNVKIMWLLFLLYKITLKGIHYNKANIIDCIVANKNKHTLVSGKVSDIELEIFAVFVGSLCCSPECGSRENYSHPQQIILKNTNFFSISREDSRKRTIICRFVYFLTKPIQSNMMWYVPSIISHPINFCLSVCLSLASLRWHNTTEYDMM